MINTAVALIYRVGILFLLMVPGILLRKCKLASDTFGKGLSGFVLYLAQPSLVFLAYLQPYDASLLRGAGWVLLFSVIAHALFAVVALLCFRKTDDARKRMLQMTTVFANAAFMGIPLIGVLFGKVGLLYATVYNIPFNLVLWSLGSYICSHKQDLNRDGVNDAHDRALARKEALATLRRAFLHPVTLAAFLGMLFFFLPIEDKIPTLLTEALDMLADTVAPLSMVVIGLRLADTKLGRIFCEWQTYVFLALRHLVMPFAILLLLKGAASLFPGVDNTVMSIVIILAACPAASSATMFAERYGCDAAYAGKLVTISTALSIITMPLLLLLV